MLKFQSQAGNPVMVSNTKITPISQAFTIHWPGRPVGFTWNRPTAIQVQYEDGTEQVLPVRDVWRLVQIALAGFAVVGMGLLWLAKKKTSQGSDSSSGGNHAG
jgi:hypothetical protein